MIADGGRNVMICQRGQVEHQPNDEKSKASKFHVEQKTLKIK